MLDKHNRGSIYLAVLGASMMVTILGVSALLAVRMQRQAGEIDHAAAEAAVLARSGVEWALLEIQRDADWRNTFTHDQWYSSVTLGRGTYRFKLVDVTDSDLSDDPNHSVEVVGEGVVGQAVRLERMVLTPMDIKGAIAGYNLLTNGDFETSRDPWVHTNTTMILARTSTRSYTGNTSLAISNRTATTDGPQHDLRDVLINGMTYDSSVWMRSKSVTDAAQIRFYINSTITGPQTFDLPVAGQSINNSGWQQLSATITPKWQGQLIDAYWRVITTGDTDDFYIDDASLSIRSGAFHSLRQVEFSGKQNFQP